jgi:hypothetical protein
MAIVATFSELESLFLNGTSVSDEGLAKLSGLENIREFSIGYTYKTRITDAGLAHLKSWTRLENLSFAATDIGPESVPLLLQFPNLNVVQGLGATKFSNKPSAVRRLNEGLPKANVTYLDAGFQKRFLID